MPRTPDQSIRIYDQRTGAFLGGGTVLGWQIDQDSDAAHDALSRHVRDCVQGAAYDGWTPVSTEQRGNARIIDIAVNGNLIAFAKVEMIAPVALEMQVAA